MLPHYRGFRSEHAAGTTAGPAAVVHLFGFLALTPSVPQPTGVGSAIAQDLCGSHLAAIVSVQSEEVGQDVVRQEVVVEEVFYQATVTESAEAEPIVLDRHVGDVLTVAYAPSQQRPAVGDRHIAFLRKLLSADRFAMVSPGAVLRLGGGQATRLSGTIVSSETEAVDHLRATTNVCADMP